ncbi:MAG: V-type ATPase 116kDa subunit family protein [Candidatus Caldarchaeum sp.]
MGLSEVVKVAVIAARHKADALVEELLRFEDFHPAEKSRFRDTKLHEIEHTAESGFVRLQALIQELGIKDSVGLIDQLLNPRKLESMTISTDGLHQLLQDLDEQSSPLVSKINKLLEDKKAKVEKIGQTRSLYTVLKAVEGIELDMDLVRKIGRFHVFVGFCSGSELAELRRALPSSAVVETAVDGLTLVLIVSKRDEGENVERVVKGLGIKALTIPPQYPQNVKLAVENLGTELRELEKELSDIDGELRRMVAVESAKLIAFRDAYALVREALLRIAGAGSLRFFAVVEGFVPAERIDEFRAKIGVKYPVLLDEENAEHVDEKPSMMDNPSVTKPFEKITLIQGYPRHGDIDPTPYVSIFFTIFYGIMFADLGQGIVILAFALFMLRRVSGDLREWAKLLAYLGVASAVTGFLLGEAFGFKVGSLIGSPELLHLVEEHGESKQFNISEVQRLLVMTILLGAAHLTIGYALAFVKYWKKGEKAEALTVKLPSLAMYVFGILFALAFFGAGGSIQRVFTAESPAPLVNLPTRLVGAVGMYGSIACILVLMLGRYAAGLAGIGHKLSIISSIGTGLLETLENIIHFLSNTISYSRVTILLIVHAALLLLLNTAWEALGLVALPLLIIGNIGIMLLEGMLVFIQAMRLHVYEFFSKFFDGTGQPFRKLAMQTLFMKIRFG